MPLNRADAGISAQDYDPRHFLPRLVKLFGECSWSHGYGGPKWANIAKAAMTYWTLPPASFVDHVVDLAHNGSFAWDKMDYGLFYLFSSEKFAEFLNKKKTMAPLELLQRSNVSEGLVKLVERGVTIGLLPKVRAWSYQEQSNHVMALLGYKPVEWGDSKVGEVIKIKKLRCAHCGDTISQDDNENQIGDSVYCDECCVQVATHCCKCDEPIAKDGELQDDDGDYYCQSCWDDLSTCEECGEVISGGEYEFEGHTYCESCYDDLVTICDHCGEHFFRSDLTRHDGDDLCESCLEQARAEEEEEVA